MSESIVTVDIGGTHVRFAIAELAGGRVASLGDAVTLRVANYTSFRAAWRDFARRQGGLLPRGVAIAVAGPAQGAIMELTNSPWSIRPTLVDEQLGVDRSLLINDFEAVGHAVALADASWFEPLCGPDGPLPETGMISIVGPGTGLGVAHVWRDRAGYRVRATEGGHIAFAPLDPVEDAMLARLRRRYGRVSAERVVSGPAIADIYASLAEHGGQELKPQDPQTIWTNGTNGTDPLAVDAIEYFCQSLGSVAGDLALAQGAAGVVIAGGLGLRIKAQLVRSGFARRFVDKGRFSDLMASIPVKLITHPQPGLFGAATAFASRHA